MTGAQAITAAVKFFSKDKSTNGDIRTVWVEEWTGTHRKLKDARIRICHSDHGDYNDSDRNPYVVTVTATEGGKIEVRRV